MSARVNWGGTTFAKPECQIAASNKSITTYFMFSAIWKPDRISEKESLFGIGGGS